MSFFPQEVVSSCCVLLLLTLWGYYDVGGIFIKDSAAELSLTFLSLRFFFDRMLKFFFFLGGTSGSRLRRRRRLNPSARRETNQVQLLWQPPLLKDYLKY